MAKATKKPEKVEKVYTEAEVAAMVAMAREEGAKAAKAAKAQAKADRDARRAKAGYHPVQCEVGDAEYNVLARGEHATPGVAHILGSSAMIDAKGDQGYAFNPEGFTRFGIPGLVFTKAQVAEFLAVLDRMIEVTPDMVSGLDRDYVKAAKRHTYRDPATRRKAAKAAKAAKPQG